MDATDPVKVFNPDGEPETVAASELGSALKMGYRLPTSEEVQDYQTDQTYGQGLANPLKAAAAGAARGATFGLSDQAMTKSGLVRPETLSGLKKANPIASTTGEVGGVLGMALAPELGLAGAAGEGAEAAAGASRLLNPVKAVSELGSAASDAASPIAGRIAGAVADPEAHALANRMIQKGLAHGLGSAVEGAAYGLGQSVSEDALGDPDALGEKLVSNVGLSAIFAGGLGGIFGAGAGALSKDATTQAIDSVSNRAAQEIPSVSEARIAATDNFENAVTASDLTDTEKASLLEGMKKLKPNVGEVDAAAQDLGVPAFPGQRSASEFVQKRYGMTTQSPSPFGVAEQQRIANASEQVSRRVDQTLGPVAPEMSEAELGNALKKGLSETVQKELDPISDLYDEIKQYHQAVPLSERGMGRIGQNVLKIPDLINADGSPLSERSPQWLLAKRVSEEVENLKTVDDLKRYRTMLRQDVKGDPALAHVHGLIQEKLGDLEDRAIVRFAENNMKTPEAKERLLGVIEMRKEANARYSSLRDKLADLGDIAGKRRIYGPQDLIRFIEDDITPEKLARKVTKLAQNNSEGLSFLKESFPQEFERVKQYIKSDIRQSAMHDGALDYGKALKQVEKLSPEARSMLFAPEEVKTLRSAKTWREAWPAKFGPSGTPQGIQYLDFFKNPAQWLGMSGRDYVGLKFSHAMAGSASGQLEHVGNLIRLERAVQKTTSDIAAGSKKIFKTGIAAAVPIAAISSAVGDRSEKKLDKIKTQLQDVTTTPEKALDVFHNATHDLYVSAPKTASGVQMASLRAAKFLSSKLPNQAPQKLLDPKSKPSPADLSKFFKYYEAVNNPTSVLDRLAHGVVAPESIEALNAVYPKLYGEMKASVMNELNQAMTKGKYIPYRTKVGLSMFLGQDLDSSTTPASIQATQSALASQSKSAGPGGAVKPSQGGLSALSMSQAALTPNQSNSQRGDV